MRFFALFLAVIASVCLVSCANNTNEYLKKDQQIPPLIVPSGVPPLKQQTYYPLPKVAGDLVVKPASTVPPTLQSQSK